MSINIIFDNFTYKIIIAIILALIVSFTNKIEILHAAISAILIFLILILMFFNFENDFGIILLLVALLALTYNNVMIKSSKKDKTI